MFLKGSLSFDLNGVKCTRKAEETPRKVLTYKSSKSVRVASKSAKNKPVFLALFAVNERLKHAYRVAKCKQLLRYQGSHALYCAKI